MSDIKHHVEPTVMQGLWDRIKNEIEGPIRMFVQMGIKPLRGESKKDAELKVWMEVAKTAFETGVSIGYDMGCVVSGAPDPTISKSEDE